MKPSNLDSNKCENIMGAKSLRITSFTDGTFDNIDDLVAEEAALQITLLKKGEERDLSMTMRTPGNDPELVVGFLFTEGMINSFAEIMDISQETDKVILQLSENVESEKAIFNRSGLMNSSCGVCGLTSIEALNQRRVDSVEKYELSITTDKLGQLHEILSEVQGLFNLTGGIHAVGLFSQEGKLLTVKEDVGRHNALDKLIGQYLMQDQLPLNKQVLLLSGRASYELIHKAAKAGIQIVAAVGAPSSLAVEEAHKNNLTLIGFLKQNGFNIYTHPNRVITR